MMSTMTSFTTSFIANVVFFSSIYLDYSLIRVMADITGKKVYGSKMMIHGSGSRLQFSDRNGNCLITVNNSEQLFQKATTTDLRHRLKVYKKSS